MSLTLHLNQTILIGLCMLPGAVAVTYLLGMLLGTWLELQGAIIAGTVGAAMIVIGIVLIILGIGMEIG